MKESTQEQLKDLITEADIESDISIEMTDDDMIDIVAARILKEYRRAFVELAK